jgi:hypothetical protein
MLNSLEHSFCIKETRDIASLATDYWFALTVPRQDAMSWHDDVHRNEVM